MAFLADGGGVDPAGVRLDGDGVMLTDTVHLLFQPTEPFPQCGDALGGARARQFLMQGRQCGLEALALPLGDARFLVRRRSG